MVKKARSAVVDKPGYVVVEDDLIIDTVGSIQGLQMESEEPCGVSLNRLHMTLNRQQEEGRRINYYKLKRSLAALTERGLLEQSDHKARKAFFGRETWPVWTVADWASWRSSRSNGD